jgi:hypothetical protein
MKKVIGLSLIIFIALTLISSVLNISRSVTFKSQDYAARVPLPIPPPPNNLKWRNVEFKRRKLWKR